MLSPIFPWLSSHLLFTLQPLSYHRKNNSLHCWDGWPSSCSQGHTIFTRDVLLFSSLLVTELGGSPFQMLTTLGDNYTWVWLFPEPASQWAVTPGTTSLSDVHRTNTNKGTSVFLACLLFGVWSLGEYWGTEQLALLLYVYWNNSHDNAEMGSMWSPFYTQGD